jgi:hypothetical protein
MMPFVASGDPVWCIARLCLPRQGPIPLLYRPLSTTPRGAGLGAAQQNMHCSPALLVPAAGFEPALAGS